MGGKRGRGRTDQICVQTICNLTTKCTKFQSLCQKNLILDHSATIQKVLIHGFQINNSALVPLGWLGKNASQARIELYGIDKCLNTCLDMISR